MTLTQRLSEFRFNLETIDLLTSMGRSSQQVIDEVQPIGFSSSQVQFIMSSRPLLSSVLLRLQLYSEQNLPDSKVRSSLGVLNNSNINSMLDTFFLQNDVVQMKTPTIVTPKVVQKVVQNVVQNVVQLVDTEELELEEEEDEIKNEVPRLDQFFSACIKQTSEATDVVKTSDFHTALTEWWSSIYEESVPDKNELKEYLNVKLGKSNKNTWSNVALV